MKKKNVFVVLLLVLFVTLVMIYMVPQNAPYHWSARLVREIQKGNTEKALLIIEEGVEAGYSMDTPDKRRTWLTTLCEIHITTPLNAACNERNISLVTALLEAGASVEAVHEGSGRAPLFEVLFEGYSSNDLAIVQQLWEYGASFEFDDHDGYPIHEVIKRSWTSSKGVVLDEHELLQGITDVFLYIAQRTDCYVLEASGRNVLHNAAVFHNWILCETLVNVFDFDLDAKDKQGKTAYDYAVQNDAPKDILQLLQP